MMHLHHFPFWSCRPTASDFCQRPREDGGNPGVQRVARELNGKASACTSSLISRAHRLTTAHNGGSRHLLVVERNDAPLVPALLNRHDPLDGPLALKYVPFSF
jgi:hypothetical protein